MRANLVLRRTLREPLSELLPLLFAEHYSQEAVDDFFTRHPGYAIPVDEQSFFTVQDGKKATLLFLLVQYSAAPAAIEYVLRHAPAMINVQRVNGATALHIAVHLGNAEAALLLLDAGANTTLRANDKLTPIAVGAMLGHNEFVQLLLREIAIDDPFHFTARYPIGLMNDNTLLQVIAGYCNAATFELCLTILDQRFKASQSVPASSLISGSEHHVFDSYHAVTEADLLARNTLKVGLIALAAASEVDAKAKVQSLVKRGVSVYEKDKFRRNIAHVALMNNPLDRDLLKYLAENFPDLFEEKHCKGKTPIEFARSIVRSKNIEEFLAQLERIIALAKVKHVAKPAVVEPTVIRTEEPADADDRHYQVTQSDPAYLYNLKIHPDIAPNTGLYTLLNLLVATDYDQQKVNEFFESNPDFEIPLDERVLFVIQGKNTATILFILVELQASLQAIETVLSRAPQLLNTQRAYNGATVLHLAAANGCAEVVQVLCAKGANRNLKAHDGFTPIARAAADGHDVVVELLLEQIPHDEDFHFRQRYSKKEVSLLQLISSYCKASTLRRCAQKIKDQSTPPKAAEAEPVSLLGAAVKEDYQVEASDNLHAKDRTIYSSALMTAGYSLVEPFEKVKCLIEEFGMDPLTETDKNGNNIAHWRLNGSRALDEGLLLYLAAQFPALFDMKNAEGKTPLDLRAKIWESDSDSEIVDKVIQQLRRQSALVGPIENQGADVDGDAFELRVFADRAGSPAPLVVVEQAGNELPVRDVEVDVFTGPTEEEMVRCVCNPVRALFTSRLFAPMQEGEELSEVVAFELKQV